MSVNLMSAIFETDFFDLKDGEGNITKASTAKLVLLAMADHANDEGEGIYPSVERMCKKTALSAQTIRNTWDALKYNGIILLSGMSKYGTNNHTINTKSFPKAIGKDAPILTLYPLDPLTDNAPPSNQSLTPLYPLDPNHHLTVNESSPANAELSELDYQKANEKVDFILATQLPAQSLRQAVTANFPFNVNWETKTAREWLQWAHGENITPEQIRQAADTWRNDKAFNWQQPSLKLIFERWPALMAANTKTNSLESADNSRGKGFSL